ncbi:hypothetical protein PX554_21015 [Sphingomonas sp. H39-1-10]|uniref:DUF4139 domain-containing protein n=1 Tax=Sphingomonas pollutisoli TaxID=3030829 RepID=UPI0023B8D405|nr:hypothetical protein [Sphingomonas pollutisoli]MDF0490617.1 hypothetical protein [Sphingomonas pollutisoli]
MRACALAAVLVAFATPSAAQDAPAIDSAAPQKLAVTIYRAPERAPDTAIDRGWLRGYALITEQRTVTVPAGRAVIRFKGVAAGILPESAIVSGLPEGVREKNLDADLLSPRTLYGASFGRPVTIRRRTGKRLVEEAGILRSGPDGAAIVQTAAGFEAVDCHGGADAIGYHGVPPALPDTPTLSVQVDSPAARTVTLTLSYLAWGFDWQANYVATLRPDGASADLLAWVTLASGDVTSFPDAETMVVAGKVKREDSAPYPGGLGVPSLVLQCLSEPEEPVEQSVPPPPPPPPPPAPMAMERAMDIVVTGAKRMVKQQDLGDLKLYRVPDRTNVAAMAQKQVALLDRGGVPVDLLYRVRLSDGDPGAVRMVLRATNRADRGLGVPLPAGPVAVFAPHGRTRLLIGEGAVTDKAIGEDVEIDFATATEVRVESTHLATGKHWEDYGLVVRNATPRPIRFEAEIDAVPARIRKPSVPLLRRDGTLRMPVTVPANGSVTLRYRQIDEA